MSDIGWPRLRSLTAREITSALVRDGFSCIASPAVISAIATPTAVG